MVYKICNIADLATLPTMNECVRERITGMITTLSELYGENRNFDNDDGGFVVYADPGTSYNEVRKVFNYTLHTAECVTCDNSTTLPTVFAHYVVNNEYVVTIIMSADDAPEEILSEI